MATQKKTPAAQRMGTDLQPGATRRVLQVVSKRDGFRRAGREWHGTSTVPVDELTDKQLEQLYHEPMLVVLELEVPVEYVEELVKADSAAPAATESIQD